MLAPTALITKPFVVFLIPIKRFGYYLKKLYVYQEINKSLDTKRKREMQRIVAPVTASTNTTYSIRTVMMFKKHT